MPPVSRGVGSILSHAPPKYHFRGFLSCLCRPWAVSPFNPVGIIYEGYKSDSHGDELREGQVRTRGREGGRERDRAATALTWPHGVRGQQEQMAVAGAAGARPRKQGCSRMLRHMLIAYFQIVEVGHSPPTRSSSPRPPPPRLPKTRFPSRIVKGMVRGVRLVHRAGAELGSPIEDR